MANNKNVTALLEKIKKDSLIEIDDNGQGKFKEGAVEKLLPEEITLDTLNKSVQAAADIAAASAIYYGSETKALYDKNKDLQTTQMKDRIGSHYELTISQKRQAVFPNNMGGKDAPPTVYDGYVSTSLTNKAMMANKKINKAIHSNWNGLSD